MVVQEHKQAREKEYLWVLFSETYWKGLHILKSIEETIVRARVRMAREHVRET